MILTPQQIIALMDLTSLQEADSPETTLTLCQKAVTPLGHVAAVCLYPRFVQQAASILKDSRVAIATVVNFPHGTDVIETVLDMIQAAIQNGATEIDVVYPYQRYQQGDKKGANEFIRQCKQVCGANVLLKVILETGALPTLEMIAEISHDVIQAGADFLKTSTGKIGVGATLPAAEVMLRAIKASDRMVGFKASGGIRTIETAQAYGALAAEIMGANWISARTLRFGASQLLDACLDYK